MKKGLYCVLVCMLMLAGILLPFSIATATPIEKSSISQPELRIKVRGGFGIHLVIENLGDAPATDVECWIVWCNISDYIIGPAPSSDSFHISTIAPGQSVTVCFRPVGLVLMLFSDRNDIEISVSCAEHSYSEVNIKNTILLWRLILLTKNE